MKFPFWSLVLVGILPWQQPEQKIVYVPVPTEEQVLLNARLIESEAASEPFLGKVAVGEVVMNRIGDYEQRGKKMQDALKYTIYRKGQFDGVGTKHFNRTPSYDSILASFCSLMGSETLPDNVLFYHNKELVLKNNWDVRWVKTLEKKEYAKIGKHTFCFK